MEIVKSRTVFRWISLLLVFPLVLFRFYFFYEEWKEVFSLMKIITNYISYFTIQNNLLVSLWFFVTIFRNQLPRVFNFFIEKRIFERLIFYALSVVIIYWFLLFKHQPKHGTLDIILKALLHINLFITLLLDYIFNIKKQRIKFNKIIKWAIYPFIYGFLVTLWSAYANWAPYPFLDWNHIRQHSEMIFTPFLILLGMSLMAAIFIAIHNRILKSNKN
ncbi:MAG: hypothetical protein ACI94Y_001860 [Maribacter sp.]|jgi:hypothetical protein